MPTIYGTEPTHAIDQFINARAAFDQPFTGVGSEAPGITYYRWLDGTEELATDEGDTIAVKRHGIITVPAADPSESARARAMRKLADLIASAVQPTPQAIRKWV